MFSSVFGLGYKSTKINGVKFILIDNSNYYGLGGAQKEWIKNEVTECKTITCITIMHMPLNNPTSAHIMGEYEDGAAVDGKWLKELLVANGIKETESGHVHRFETYTLEGIKTNLVGAAADSRFSEFTVKSSGDIIKKIQL